MYKNRNPALLSKNQSQVHIQQQNGVMAHYQQQPNVQIVERNGSQGQRGNSGEVRGNSRSLERRQTNVVFNYNVSQVGVQQNRVIQQMIQQAPQQGVRSASLSPVPISVMQPPVISKPQVQPLISQPVPQLPLVPNKIQEKSTQQM